MKYPCPTCQKNTRALKEVTLQSLLSGPAASVAAGDFQGFRFCPNTSCETLYFQPERNIRFTEDAVAIAVFQKSESPERLVCYCFGHSVADINAEVRETGSSSAIASISEKCRKGEDRCPETNPQGSCCLGNVRSVVKLAQSLHTNTQSSTPANVPQSNESCCCTSETKNTQ